MRRSLSLVEEKAGPAAVAVAGSQAGGPVERVSEEDMVEDTVDGLVEVDMAEDMEAATAVDMEESKLWRSSRYEIFLKFFDTNN